VCTYVQYHTLPKNQSGGISPAVFFPKTLNAAERRDTSLLRGSTGTATSEIRISVAARIQTIGLPLPKLSLESKPPTGK
jgi:hypothetical protein